MFFFSKYPKRKLYSPETRQQFVCNHKTSHLNVRTEPNEHDPNQSKNNQCTLINAGNINKLLIPSWFICHKKAEVNKGHHSGASQLQATVAYGWLIIDSLLIACTPVLKTATTNTPS